MPREGDPLSRALDALFPEARRLQRRRRLRHLVLVLLVGAVAAALLRTGDSGRRAAVPAQHGSLATATRVALPPAGHFSSLAVVGRRLLLSGGPPGSLPVSGYETSLVDGRAAGTCNAAAVDPRTLAIGPIVSANCGDPSLYGEHVLPIAYLLRRAGANRTGVGMIGVRIARSDHAARDGYTLGPVVTMYPECSDCQIAWIYGDGSLWVYNPLPRRARGPAVLLRISTTTGALLERWSMPEIIRALLAVDANGLWLTPSIESGIPGPLPPSGRIPYQSLYRVLPGEGSPQRVLTEDGGYARWLVANGNTASAAIATGRLASEIWTFTGLTRRAHGAKLDADGVGTELGTGGPTVAGNGAIGFYNVALGNGTENVIRVKPDSGRERTVATIPSRDASSADPAPIGVAIDGSFFFLDPPANESQSSGELHRVTPR